MLHHYPNTHCLVVASIALGILVGGSRAALAQVQQPQRQERGLFGGPAPDPKTHQALDASLSVFDAYDDDVTAEQSGGGSANPVGGQYGGINAAFTFSRSGEHVDFGLSGGSNYRYYPNTATINGVTDQAGIRFGLHSRRTSVNFSQSVGYQPFFSFAPFVPDLAADTSELRPASIDTVVQRRTATTFNSQVEVRQELGRHASFSGEYSIHHVDYSGEGATQRGESAGAHFLYTLTRDATLKLGYTLQQSEYSAAVGVPRQQFHNIDAGIDYHKALGLTRKTTMGFTMGSVAFDQTGTVAYRVTGTASLNREMGRTWVARVNYSRGVRVIDGFRDPAFDDSVTASIQGLLSRRLDLNASTAYSKGAVGVTTASNDFDSVNGDARLRFAFTRMLAAYIEYVVYRYQFSQTADLPQGFTPHTLRQGVRGGLTLQLPLVR
jgi:hypothetical protein